MLAATAYIGLERKRRLDVNPMKPVASHSTVVPTGCERQFCGVIYCSERGGGLYVFDLGEMVFSSALGLQSSYDDKGRRVNLKTQVVRGGGMQ